MADDPQTTRPGRSDGANRASRAVAASSRKARVGEGSTLLAWFPVLAWMGLIFVFSHDPESGARTGPLARTVAWLWQALAGAPPDAGTLEVLHLGLRKVGHMVEYGVLYGLVLRARLHSSRPGWFVPLAVAVAYASADEWHQTFISNRVGSLGDVAVDACGAALAAVLLARRAG